MKPTKSNSLNFQKIKEFSENMVVLKSSQSKMREDKIGDDSEDIKISAFLNHKIFLLYGRANTKKNESNR